MISSAFAVSSLRAYFPAFQQYVAFCLNAGLAWSLILPPEASVVVAYATSMFCCGRTEGTARKAISSLCSIVSALGYSTAGVRCRQLELLLKRYRQLRPSVRRAIRHPCTLPLLRLLLPHTRSVAGAANVAALTLRALLLCLFFGFFRPGELLDCGPDANDPPLRDAITFSGTYATLHLLASKTDLFRLGCDVHLPRLDGPLCPFSALFESMAHAFSTLPFSPLFQDALGNAVTYSSFASMLASLVSAAGLSRFHITPHSFRIGAATTAAACGIPDSALKALGRWQSVSYQVYARYTPEHLRQIALQISCPSSSSLSPSSPFGAISSADAVHLNFDSIGASFSSSQRRR